jgi:hypothetical protein
VGTGKDIHVGLGFTSLTVLASKEGTFRSSEKVSLKERERPVDSSIGSPREMLGVVCS